MNKTIANIVFYKYWDPTKEENMQQACIFYEDGTVKSVSYQEGKELVNKIEKSENVKTKADFEKLINTKRIFTLSGAEFERRFKEFLGNRTSVVPTKDKPLIVVPPTNKTGTTSQEPPKKKEETPVIISPIKTTPEGTKTGTSGELNKPKKWKYSKNKKKNKKKKKKKISGLFKKLWVKVTAFILAGAMLFTGGYWLGRNSKSGDIINNNISNESQDDFQAQDQAYLNLIKKSTSEAQKTTMTHQGQSLDIFNRDFANAHIEEGKDVKASLTWDEMMALNLAYNTYTKEQIKIMFNGAEVDSTTMSNAYKNATLQLMGAYVVSTRENPVNSSSFLINPEERAFVEKYNNLFLTMKETKGEEQVTAINAFYAELHKDFPIVEEVREEGISHGDSRQQLESYKAAVTPMVAAAEIMFQNVSNIDHTLSDKAIKYFNDLGLCNLVDEQFKRAETITLAAVTDEKQPLYTEFRNAKITELIYEGNYPTDDSHRDLSQLEAFQNWVNGHFEIVDGVNTGKVIANPSTTTKETKTEISTSVTNNRNEAVSKVGENAVKNAENIVTSELEKQNKVAQQQAQTEADKKSEAAKKEAAEDAEDMQNKLNNANNTITNGGTVNESDFGDHNVDFDTEFEDGNGNLSDSVTDITTDGTGAKTENDLPDPNQTGAIFDGKTTTNTESIDNNNVYEYEEPYYGGMSNEQIVDAYIASLEGQGSQETAKVYTK